MVIINQVRVRYGNQLALSIDTPLSFKAGDRIGIIGSNGAGKSTFVKTILGLTNYQGSIATDLKPEEMAVHMQHNHYSNAMAVKHIMESILNTKIKKNEILQDLISFFDFEECLHKKYSALSGGQKQRLTIILVLVQDAPLVFFDEVTSGLDFETRQKLMSKLVEWYRNKTTTLCIVSHYYEELEQLVNNILILEKGQVVDFGDKDELFRKYCGKTVITVDNTPENEEITKNFLKLEAPGHLIALSCQNDQTEKDIAELLIRKDINFRRSNNNIEIMSINAKNKFNGGGKRD
ncbi:ATP-binding cassette domain-containing protein [Anaerocolumna xylanovorans]|uniref:ABC-2 type transport system ATP-binding protein n=1 Tax=Anaerocolumna xylanovorans DSM 12503 TaxID=1121345 RepID=A0A1M7YMQ0_9FIRM|nr:ABC transporter ATP-binding protein [Anaerocolumna xylanovorans]SHO53914.1 ABC-2 type transport system ATP-binding protein [Anaerocolumna xylanovorans DSM 12503]